MKINRWLLSVLVVAIVLFGIRAYLFGDNQSNSDSLDNTNHISNNLERYLDLNQQIFALKQELSRFKAEIIKPGQERPLVDADIENIHSEIVRLSDAMERIQDELDVIRKDVSQYSLHDSEDLVFANYQPEIEDTMAASTSALREFQHNTEATLIAEETDLKWANNITDRVQNAFISEELAGSQLSNIECRSTLCRIEVQHDNKSQYDQFNLWFPMKIAEYIQSMAGNETTKEADGKIVSSIFLVRKGHTMPKLP